MSFTTSNNFSTILGNYHFTFNSFKSFSSFTVLPFHLLLVLGP